MQLYRVKLLEGHTANPDQIVGEYLGNYSTIDPALYKKSEAQKKAKMFGGKIEAFGRNYHTVDLKIIQIPVDQFSQQLINELNGRESFIDTDRDLNEVLYSADVFEAILGEIDELNNLSNLSLDKLSAIETIEQLNLIRFDKHTQLLIDELLVLCELTKEYQYVMIRKI